MCDALKTIQFNKDGLVPAIIQNAKDKTVLMLGYMNLEALQKTIEGPHVWFYSRSKNRLWKKGETSGHTQTVKNILIDCDADTVLVLVEQNVAACHKGYRSCFFRELADGEWIQNQEKVFLEDKVYNNTK